jgi:hypothetical protein
MLEEAARVARDAGINGSLVFVLPFLANALSPNDEQRAHALLDEAIAVATRIGDLMAVASARGNQASIAAYAGKWDVALRATVTALGELREVGDQATARSGLYQCAVVLPQLGALEPGAILLGKADSTGGRFGLDPWMRLLEETDRLLAARLGERKVAELAAHGAALSFAEAVEYARVEAERVLAATSAPAS